MKEIPLTQGKVALVDDEDYDYLMQWKWCATKDYNTYYANREGSVKEDNKKFIMHRVIMNTPDNMVVDHIDHNGLNNQKSNMRNCSPKENSRNMRPRGKTGYLGVCYDRKYIKACIKIRGKNRHLGNYKTEEEAARAYDKVAKEYYGEFANLNFKEL